MRTSQIASVVGAGLLVVLTYIPFIFVLANSFKTGTQFAHDPFAILLTFHLKNYVEAWQGMAAYLGNTVIVAAIAIAIGIPAAAGAGYMFAVTQFRAKETLFLAYLGLLMIPFTLTLIPLFIEVKDFGIYNTWWALILPYAAGSQPLLVFLFRVFFEGIPAELYDSARIDGCSEAGVLFRIVVPLSIPVFITGALLMSISVWGDYLWPTVALSNYHLYTVSAGLETFLGSFGLTAYGIGPAFAAEIISMIPIAVLVTVGMRYFVSGLTSGALKA